jgi:hypothetical protein
MKLMLSGSVICLRCTNFSLELHLQTFQTYVVLVNYPLKIQEQNSTIPISTDAPSVDPPTSTIAAENQF